jgi:hypothetical protein
MPTKTKKWTAADKGILVFAVIMVTSAIFFVTYYLRNVAVEGRKKYKRVSRRVQVDY